MSALFRTIVICCFISATKASNHQSSNSVSTSIPTTFLKVVRSLLQRLPGRWMTCRGYHNGIWPISNARPAESASAKINSISMWWMRSGKKSSRVSFRIALSVYPVLTSSHVTGKSIIRIRWRCSTSLGIRRRSNSKRFRPRAPRSNFRPVPWPGTHCKFHRRLAEGSAAPRTLPSAMLSSYCRDARFDNRSSGETPTP